MGLIPFRKGPLVGSDCIPGKGALGVQAAAAMGSGEEQEEQEKGDRSGKREAARPVPAAITPDS